jgi:hypothetical protein
MSGALPHPEVVINDFADNFFDRMVQRNQSDHDLYHQDKFNRDDNHWHIKLIKQIDKDVAERLSIAFASAGLFDAREKQFFVLQWSTRNDVAIAAFERQLNYNKSHDFNSIIKHIQTISDIDTLFALQHHLLKNKFDYLRELTGKRKISFWRGTDSDAKIVTTSKTWAMIEKAFTLQIANLMRNLLPVNKDLFHVKSDQLRTNHAFFAMKRFDITGLTGFTRSTTYRAFRSCDNATFNEKYESHFRKYAR